MKIEDQVLSIEQVRELQELGFDIDKHSSLRTNGKEVYTKDDWYIGGAPLFSTMTIGDIIKVLPVRLEDSTFTLGINSSKVEYYSKYFDSYSFEAIEETLIDVLYETLKWCIKQKHIAL